MTTSDELTIRRAEPRDVAFLVEANRAMALETEDKVLQPEVLERGVRALFERPALGFYLVAEPAVAAAGPVASLLITTEWSDWRAGVFWWIQSVWVRPDWRRRGVYRRMDARVRELGAEQGDVCGFRLYVERENAAAQRTYEALGMVRTRYLMYEAEAGPAPRA
jgi:ribosomal protein S18 acetylase RimI-like enzyme